ncbi:MAG: DUF6206 family protein [candidate division KSB1 bacterium]|nr:DUF6206 family protein [candidate division KSB1 bacterium]
MVVDIEVLQQFEQGLNPRHPERSAMPARVLGFGEISTVLAVDVPGLRGVALKRMPLFVDQEEAERYIAAYEDYCRLLTAEIGLRLPDYGHAVVIGQGAEPVVYLLQEQLPADSMGNRLIHHLRPEEVATLVRRILRELRKVWQFNARQKRLQVAIDGQISNWAVVGQGTGKDLHETPILYVDTSTPLFRVDGVEQLDTELFLRSAPSFLVWILRLFFLKDVVDRYYDFHRVVVDLAANFFKEQRPDLIPLVVSEANDFFAGEASDLRVAPLTEKEVAAYYRQDAFIWRLYLAMRKTDRVLRTRLLRRAYPYILPDKIKR